jgi:hypothetical protein
MADANSPTERWKESPNPGPEQEVLNTLFDSGRITQATQAHEIYSENKVFWKYKLGIFRQHFNSTKKRRFNLTGKPTFMQNYLFLTKIKII